MNLFLPVLIFGSDMCLRIELAVCVRITLRMSFIVYGCVTTSNVYGSLIPPLTSPEQGVFIGSVTWSPLCCLRLHRTRQPYFPWLCGAFGLDATRSGRARRYGTLVILSGELEICCRNSEMSTLISIGLLPYGQ